MTDPVLRKHSDKITSFGYLSEFADHYQNSQARFYQSNSAFIRPSQILGCYAINPASIWDDGMEFHWQSDYS